MISTTDLVLNYSGGIFNSDPADSLGGMKSHTSFTASQLHALFDSSAERDKRKQNVDYRCIYITNTHDDEAIYDVKVWIVPQTNDGCNITMGVVTRPEIQQIVIAQQSSVTSGSFTLRLDGNETTAIQWDTASAMAAAIEAALESLANVESVGVTTSTSGGSRRFDVQFKEDDSNRLFPLLQVSENNLLRGTEIATVRIVGLQRGSPINDLAVSIGFANNKPARISFGNYTAANPLNIGTLRPKEFFHLWFKRTIERESSVTALRDSFSLRLRGRSPNYG